MYEKPRFKKREVRYKVHFSKPGKRWFTYDFWKAKTAALLDRNYRRNTLGQKAIVVKETITREIVPDDSEQQGEK